MTLSTKLVVLSLQGDGGELGTKDIADATGLSKRMVRLAKNTLLKQGFAEQGKAFGTIRATEKTFIEGWRGRRRVPEELKKRPLNARLIWLALSGLERPKRTVELGELLNINYRSASYGVAHLAGQLCEEGHPKRYSLKGKAVMI